MMEEQQPHQPCNSSQGNFINIHNNNRTQLQKQIDNSKPQFPQHHIIPQVHPQYQYDISQLLQRSQSSKISEIPNTPHHHEFLQNQQIASSSNPIHAEQGRQPVPVSLKRICKIATNNGPSSHQEFINNIPIQKLPFHLMDNFNKQAQNSTTLDINNNSSNDSYYYQIQPYAIPQHYVDQRLYDHQLLQSPINNTTPQQQPTSGQTPRIIKQKTAVKKNKKTVLQKQRQSYPYDSSSDSQNYQLSQPQLSSHVNPTIIQNVQQNPYQQHLPPSHPTLYSHNIQSCSLNPPQNSHVFYDSYPQQNQLDAKPQISYLNLAPDELAKFVSYNNYQLHLQRQQNYELQNNNVLLHPVNHSLHTPDASADIYSALNQRTQQTPPPPQLPLYQPFSNTQDNTFLHDNHQTYRQHNDEVFSQKNIYPTQYLAHKPNSKVQENTSLQTISPLLTQQIPLDIHVPSKDSPNSKHFVTLDMNKPNYDMEIQRHPINPLLQQKVAQNRLDHHDKSLIPPNHPVQWWDPHANTLSSNNSPSWRRKLSNSADNYQLNIDEYPKNYALGPNSNQQQKYPLGNNNNYYKLPFIQQQQSSQLSQIGNDIKYYYTSHPPHRTVQQITKPKQGEVHPEVHRSNEQQQPLEVQNLNSQKWYPRHPSNNSLMPDINLHSPNEGVLNTSTTPQSLAIDSTIDTPKSNAITRRRRSNTKIPTIKKTYKKRSRTESQQAQDITTAVANVNNTRDLEKGLQSIFNDTNSVITIKPTVNSPPKFIDPPNNATVYPQMLRNNSSKNRFTHVPMVPAHSIEDPSRYSIETSQDTQQTRTSSISQPQQVAITEGGNNAQEEADFVTKTTVKKRRESKTIQQATIQRNMQFSDDLKTAQVSTSGMNKVSPTVTGTVKVDLKNYASQVEAEELSVDAQALSTGQLKCEVESQTSNNNLSVGNELRQSIEEIILEVDPRAQITQQAETYFLKYIDSFISDAARGACKIAKHRGAKSLSLEDIRLEFEHNWNLMIPETATLVKGVMRDTPNSLNLARLSGAQRSLQQ